VTGPPPRAGPQRPGTMKMVLYLGGPRSGGWRRLFLPGHHRPGGATRPQRHVPQGHAPPPWAVRGRPGGIGSHAAGRHRRQVPVEKARGQPASAGTKGRDVDDQRQRALQSGKRATSPVVRHRTRGPSRRFIGPITRAWSSIGYDGLQPAS